MCQVRRQHIAHVQLGAPTLLTSGWRLEQLGPLEGMQYPYTYNPAFSLPAGSSHAWKLPMASGTRAKPVLCS